MQGPMLLLVTLMSVDVCQQIVNDFLMNNQIFHNSMKNTQYLYFVGERSVLHQ